MSGARGRGRSSQGPNLGLWGGLGAGLVLLMVAWFVTRNGDDASSEVAAAPKTASEDGSSAKKDSESPIVDPMGWEGKLMRAAVAIHTAARGANTGTLKGLLDGRGFWHREELARAAEAGTQPRSEEAFAILPTTEIDDVLMRVVASLKEGRAGELIYEWEPYDGQVLDMQRDKAHVRLTLAPAAGGAEKRFIDWRMTKDTRGNWRAYSWEPFGDDPLAEAKAAEAARASEEEETKPPPVKTITFADGKEIYERDPEPLEHLDSTPPDLQEQIESLYATLINLDLTRESAAAKRELVKLGKPVIPILLSGLYETKLTDDESRIRANLMVVTLRNITGRDFGYDPQARLGKQDGVNKERSDSAIKQWFAWWYQNKQVFDEKQREDMLKDHIQLTDKDKAWLRRHADD